MASVVLLKAQIIWMLLLYSARNGKVLRLNYFKIASKLKIGLYR